MGRFMSALLVLAVSCRSRTITVTQPSAGVRQRSRPAGAPSWRILDTALTTFLPIAGILNAGAGDAD